MWKTSHEYWKHKKWYICFVIKVARTRAFSNLSSHRIEINYEHMAILWTRFNHMFWTCFGSKFALGIQSVLLSFPLVIWSALSSLFPRDLIFFAVSNRKPIWIIEKVKQIRRYWIRYADNRVYHLDLSICKQSWDSVQWNQHKSVMLTGRPWWEGQTRLIPSVSYLRSFHAFAKPWRYTVSSDGQHFSVLR